MAVHGHAVNRGTEPMASQAPHAPHAPKHDDNDDNDNLLLGFDFPDGVCVDASGHIYVADASAGKWPRQVTTGDLVRHAGTQQPPPPPPPPPCHTLHPHLRRDAVGRVVVEEGVERTWAPGPVFGSGFNAVCVPRAQHIPTSPLMHIFFPY